MKITISNINSKNIKRASQLINKVNQFNLTTKRYNENDLTELIIKGYIIYTIRVEDRFGDTGLTGVVIVNPLLNKVWELDTFLLSCRVLGRNIEKIVLNFIFVKAKNNNIKKIIGEYIQSSRNNIVKNFYKDLNFRKNNSNIWEYDLSRGQIYENNICEVIEVNE